MKKIDLKKLFFALSTAKEKGGVKFKYGCNKNIIRIEKDIDIFKVIETDNEKIIAAFSGAKLELIKRLGKVNEQGQYYISPEDDIDKFTEFVTELKVLEETHKDDLSKYNEAQKDYSNLLLEDLEEIELHKIDFENVPEDLSGEEMLQLQRFEII